MNSFETIAVESRDGVATITLNRPNVFNALNEALLLELRTALDSAHSDDSVGAVVVAGTGKAFSAGQDLRGFREDAVEHPETAVRQMLEERYIPVVKAISGMPKPLIAAVNGVAAGAGMSLALAADLRIAADSASFTLAFSRIALIPDAGANYFLPRLVGLSRALELAWTARRVSADEALAMGLVNQVVPAAELMDRAQEMAAALARGPRLALSLTKQAMQRGISAALEEVMELEAELQARASTSADFREGVQAFIEKREPQFGADRAAASATRE